jgi:hypothetical protein
MESNRRVRDPCDPGSVSDLIAFLPDNAERVVTSTSSTASSPLDRIGWCTHEVIAPWPHMPNLIQLVQGTEQVLPTAMIRYMVVAQFMNELHPMLHG